MKIPTMIVLSILCAACGGGIDSYEDALEIQTDIMAEMVDVLEAVDDERSAEKAAADIEKLGARLVDVAQQMEALPDPTLDEIQAMAKQRGELMQVFQQDAATQMMKFAQYPALGQAWSRAVANIN